MMHSILFPGGVLFSLEEGASFWNQNLTWRIVSGDLKILFNARWLRNICPFSTCCLMSHNTYLSQWEKICSDWMLAWYQRIWFCITIKNSQRIPILSWDTSFPLEVIFDSCGELKYWDKYLFVGYWEISKPKASRKWLNGFEISQVFQQLPTGLLVVWTSPSF